MAGLPAIILAARMTMLPVMWAVNSPLRPRKPMLSVEPATTLKRNGSPRIAGSAAGKPVSNHLCRIDDLVKALFVDIAQSERGLLQAQILVIGLVRDGGGLVIADHRTQCGHQHQRAAAHLVDALAVEPCALD